MTYEQLTPAQKKVADKIGEGLSQDTLDMSPVEVVILALSFLDDRAAKAMGDQIK